MAWTWPIKESTRVPEALAELTPFVFRDRLYRLENFVRHHDFPGTPPGYRFHENGFRIRDVATDQMISVPLLDHYFGIAYCWEGRCYAYAGKYPPDQTDSYIRQTVMISSDDLITWTKPQVVMEADGQERLFNYAVCRARGKFYMLYETNDRRWPPFTMRFCESDDLIHWRKLGPEYIYGTEKYTGGPALYYDDEEDWFYCLYLEDLGRKYETRVTRSRDMMQWTDAPPDRPVVTFDLSRDVAPERFPGVKELSASDVEICEFNGQTLVYWISGNQQGASMQYCETFDGSMNTFLRGFFE